MPFIATIFPSCNKLCGLGDYFVGVGLGFVALVIGQPYFWAAFAAGDRLGVEIDGR